MDITTVGFDLAKHVFHIHGVDVSRWWEWNVCGECGPISAPLVQIQTYHETEDSPHGRHRSTCRLAAPRELAAGNGALLGPSASAASYSIDD